MEDVLAPRLSDAASQLALDGDLTIYTAPALKEKLLAALAHSETLEVDLSRIGDADSAGVQLLLLAQRYAQRNGKALHLSAPSAPVRELLTLYRLQGLCGQQAGGEQP